jgi:uncharacterized membrane protein
MEDPSENWASFARRATVTGVATMLPVFLTAAALLFAWSVLSGFLRPLADVALIFFFGENFPVTVLEVAVAVALLWLTMFVGAVAEARSTDSFVVSKLEHLVASIPVVGSVYQTAERLSEMFFENDTGSFREVVLVELPDKGLHMLGFVTAESPESVQDATDADLTVFVPLAPNPVMAGFLVNVARDQVTDVEMTVEEGVQSVMTTGVAGGRGLAAPPLGSDDAREVIEESLDGERVSGEDVDGWPES